MNLIGTDTIETDNLILRRFTAADAEDMYNNWASDPLVTRYLTWGPHENVGVSRCIIDSWVEEYKKDSTFNWAIVPLDFGRPIGSIGAVELNMANRWCEIGYCIGSAFWGRGIMTEALCWVIDYMFRYCEVNRIQARHDVRNPASGRVMEKAGMKYEGTLKQIKLNRDGSFADCKLYSIIKSEYSEK